MESSSPEEVINKLPVKTKKDNKLNVPKIQKRNQGRRQTFGEIQEMDIQMEQTQNDIPLLTEMPNNADDTRQNDPFSSSTDNESPGDGERSKVEGVRADANDKGRGTPMKIAKRSIELHKSAPSGKNTEDKQETL